MSAAPRQLVLDLAFRPALGREDFLVAAANAEAVRWLESWRDWDKPALALHGPAGSGKTHLCHVFMSLAEARPARLGEAIFAGAWVLDDADRVLAEGGRAAEEALLHLYNGLGEGGGRLLLSGRQPPARWNIALADLRSRLNALPAVGLGAPDDELLGAVLVKLFADRQLVVEPGLIGFLLGRCERSFGAARRLVAALDRAGLAAGRAITVPLAREVIQRMEDDDHGSGNRRA